jgi:lipoprotein-anchoring transpeptidase ErfK/SrfK
MCGAFALLLGSASPPARIAPPPPALRMEIAGVMEADTAVFPPAETLIPAPLPTTVEPPPAAVPAPEPRPSSPVRIVVSIPQQKAYVFRHGELVATSPVSTGKKGHETPAGTFRILQKKVHHRSNRYSNAPMPYMQRLTWGGVALHAGHLPGYRASHGCIRLPRAFAKKLYGMTNFATEVTVTHSKPKSARDAARIA